MYLFTFTAVAANHARIVVASPYDRELDLIKIKADENRAADRIVLCESNVTQAGHPRALKLQDVKRIVPSVEIFNTTCSKTARDYKLGWGCEGAPRKCAISMACRNEPNSTVVIISDADEIVSDHVIKSMAKNPPGLHIEVSFRNGMSVFMYGFFWQNVGARYSTARALTCGTYRADKITAHVNFPGWSGWHCSYCFPVDQYLSKMHSMLKGDGWLSLSDHYWSMETLYAFRQHGLPFNGQKKLQPPVTPHPRAADAVPYLIRNTHMNIKAPKHPFKFPPR